MERHPPLPMTPFDTLVTSKELQMMKLMLPYTPSSYQKFLAFYIKFIELQNTIRTFGLFHSHENPKMFGKSAVSPMDILDDLRPYLGKESETIDMILSAMSMMDMMKGMDMPDMSDMGDMSGMMDLMNMFNAANNSEASANNNEASANSDDNFHNHKNKKGNDNDDERLDEPPGNEEY